MGEVAVTVEHLENVAKNLSNQIFGSHSNLQSNLDGLQKQILDHLDHLNDEPKLYKTFYYGKDQFVNGVYDKIVGLKGDEYNFGTKFIDFVGLYETPERTDTPTSFIAWNDNYITIPGAPEDKGVFADEKITVTLPDDTSCSFVGGYRSLDGYYKIDKPTQYYLKNSSVQSNAKKVEYSSLRIELHKEIEGLRVVTLYTN